MADEPENLVLQFLRKFDQRQERMEADLHGIMVRVTAAIEEGMAGIHRRMDRMDERLRRIEPRLELTEASS